MPHSHGRIGPESTSSQNRIASRLLAARLVALPERESTGVSPMTAITDLPPVLRERLMELVKSPEWPNRTIVIRPIRDPLELHVPHNTIEDAEAAVAQAGKDIGRAIPPELKPGRSTNLFEAGERLPSMKLMARRDGSLEFWKPSSPMRPGGRATVTITRYGQVLYYGKRPPLVLLDKQYREYYNTVHKCLGLLTEGNVEMVPVRGRGASPKP
jgi:hypothetical protein